MKLIINKIYKFLTERPILLMLILFSVASMFITPDFLTKSNLENILIQASSLAVVACGVTFVVLNGGVDFSSTSVIALASVIGSSIMSRDGGLLANSIFAAPVAIIAMLIVGLLFGAINGFSVIKFKMLSFIVTLATMMIGSGIAVWYTKGETINDLPQLFSFIGSGRIFGIPVIIIIALIVILSLNFVLSKTLFGRQIYAVGTNPKTSFISGIPVKKIIFKMFLVSGFCSALASVMMTARMESGAPGLGSNMFLDIIASIIIGGTSIFGGSGSVIGTVVGVLFLTMMNNSLNMAGVSWFVIDIVKGAIVLVTAFTDIVRTRKSGS
jgi:ribose/xylose/arabinose/galactoside ABC-type transport system permease subunit